MAVEFSAVGFGKRLVLPAISTASVILLPPSWGNWVAVGFSAVGFGKRLVLPAISIASAILLPPPVGEGWGEGLLGLR